MEHCTVSTLETNSRFYADTLEDLTVMNLAGEMGQANDEPFELEKPKVSYEFLKKEGARFEVRTETEGLRKGMISGMQPQVICEIGKT